MFYQFKDRPIKEILILQIFNKHIYWKMENRVPQIKIAQIKLFMEYQ